MNQVGKFDNHLGLLTRVAVSQGVSKHISSLQDKFFRQNDNDNDNGHIEKKQLQDVIDYAKTHQFGQLAESLTKTLEVVSPDSIKLEQLQQHIILKDATSALLAGIMTGIAGTAMDLTLPPQESSSRIACVPINDGTDISLGLIARLSTVKSLIDLHVDDFLPLLREQLKNTVQYAQDNHLKNLAEELTNAVMTADSINLPNNYDVKGNNILQDTVNILLEGVTKAIAGCGISIKAYEPTRPQAFR